MSNGRNNKTLVFLIVILLISNIGLLLYFFVLKPSPKKPGGPRNDFSVVDYMKKEVGFNDDQSKQFEVLHNQNKESLKVISDSIRGKKNALYKILQEGGNPTDSVVNEMTASIGAYQQRLELTMFRHFEKVRSLCTPDQRTKFDTMVNRMNNRSPWFRRGGGGRGPDTTQTKN